MGMHVDVAARQDEDGAAYAGSQLQTQLYVNRWTDALDDAIRSAFPELDGAAMEWRSPLAVDGYREYWDKPFLRSLDLPELADKLPDFWPTGGPHWDALGLVHLPIDAAIAGADTGVGRPGVVLVEGKSYPAELFGSGMGAKEGSMAYNRILESLAWTQNKLGVSGKSPQDWCGRLYQSANRLAHLCWLREQGVQTWLVHLLFTGDKHGPTTAGEWERAMADADEELGVVGISVPAATHVTLVAGIRDDLLN